MHPLRSLALAAALGVAIPTISWAAQPQWDSSPINQPAYREGYDRGVRAGSEDVRRGDRFQFADESDYRRGDAGYRSQYGNREFYRDTFRRGFEDGYRVGYGGAYDRQGPGGYGTGGYGNGRAVGRYDIIAYQHGMNDGYEAGLKDARDRRRYDPIGEGRYRSADHGYDRRYGPREAYKNDYRVAFKDGYDRGYQDGRRYTGRRWF